MGKRGGLWTLLVQASSQNVTYFISFFFLSWKHQKQTGAFLYARGRDLVNVVNADGLVLKAYNIVEF